MDTVFVETLERLTSLLERSPLNVMLAVILLTLFYLCRRIAKNIKIEHVFQHTLSNKIKLLKNKINDGVIEKEESTHLKNRYVTLSNQQIYGIKNRIIQQEVIGIINHSSEITDFKYFAVHQYVLSIDNGGKLYFNKSKISSRTCTAFMLLVIGLAALALGIFIMSAGSFFGLFISFLGLLLYFAGLVHFPDNSGMRKRAEKEIAHYYQHRDAAETHY